MQNFRKIRHLFLFAACFGFPYSAESHALQNLPADTTFHISSVHANRCLDVGGGGDSNGAAIIQFDCHHGPSEQFKLLPDGDAYQIKTMHGKCVDVFQWKTDNGAEVMQYDCQDGNNQKFFV